MKSNDKSESGKSRIWKFTKSNRVKWPIVFTLLFSLAASLRATDFVSTTNGFWTVSNTNEAYAWNDSQRRRPQSGDSAEINGHTVSLRQNESINQLTFNSGTLNLSNFSLTLFGDSSWKGGWISGRLTNNAALTLDGADSKRLSNKFMNSGTLTIHSGANLQLDNQTVVTNLAGSDFEISGHAGIASSGEGSGAFPLVSLNGSAKKTGDGTATIGFGVFLENDGGALEIQAGELHCDMPYIQNSGSTRLAGGTLSCLSSISFLGGELAGSGVITGSVVNVAAFKPDGVFSIEGNFTQTPAGAFEANIDGSSASGNFDRLTTSGVLTIGGALTLVVATNFTPVVGDVYPLWRGQTVFGHFNQTNVLNLDPFLTLVPIYLTNGVDVQVVQILPPTAPELVSAVSGTNFLIQFQSEQNVNYQLETTTVLAPADWEVVGNTTGDGGLATFLYSPNTAAARFFRVRIIFP
jgi:hypothetical protein